MLAACTAQKAHELSFEVSFACAEDRELADELQLRVLAGGCAGEEIVFEDTLTKGEQAEAFHGIEAGSYGLSASAFRAGELLASGCIEATLPKPKDADAPRLELRAATCDAPVVEVDAGTTAPTEGGAPAADSGQDARVSDAASMDAASMDAALRTCSSDCKDSFPCTEDRCVNGECVHDPFTGARECDGVACTEADLCEMGSCTPGTPNHAACADDGNPCTKETCELSTGCDRDNAEGAACNDQIGCTNLDSCRGGICRGTDSCTGGAVCSAASGRCTACTSAADCDDRDPCTTDSCSMGTCSSVPNTASCNDGKACTNNDVCNNRVCAGVSTCPSDATCGGSSCRCNDGSKALCSNTCVTLASSTQHCGQCGRVCTNASCENGACKPSAANNCTAYRYNNHDYLLCTDVLSWTSARDRCRGYGFGLAIIQTQAENDFLRTRTVPPAANRWMGANDRGNNGDDCRLDEEEGTWYWADPTNVNEDNFANRPFCAFVDRNATTCSALNNSYQNWRSGEPNNDNCSSCGIGDCTDGEDCGVLYADGTWNDAECGNGLGFICETP